MKIKEQKIQEFLEELAGSKPTPGGGAVAALTAATAAALIEMVAGLTKSGAIDQLGQEAGELRGKLLNLSDADSAAFDKVMEAYRSKDKIRIREALEGATIVPEQTKEYAARVEEIAKVAEAEGNRNAVSDARTAIYLAQAAQKSAQENVDINKKSLANLE